MKLPYTNFCIPFSWWDHIVKFKLEGYKYMNGMTNITSVLGRVITTSYFTVPCINSRVVRDGFLHLPIYSVPLLKLITLLSIVYLSGGKEVVHPTYLYIIKIYQTVFFNALIERFLVWHRLSHCTKNKQEERREGVIGKGMSMMGPSMYRKRSLR